MENNMKTYNCPSYGAKIALRDINVKSDVMLCRACRWMWRNTSINGWFIGWRKIGDPPTKAAIDLARDF